MDWFFQDGGFGPSELDFRLEKQQSKLFQKVGINIHDCNWKIRCHIIDPKRLYILGGSLKLVARRVLSMKVGLGNKSPTGQY